MSSRGPGRYDGLVPGVGFEPTRAFTQRILSPPRLPFRHPGMEADDRTMEPSTGPALDTDVVAKRPTHLLS